MPPSNIATAADYADAMMIARRAKNLLFFLLLLMLLLQLTIFFVARLTPHVIPDAASPTDATVTVTTLAATAPSTQPIAALRDKALTPMVLRYVTSLIDFGGMIFILVMVVVLLLIVKIMLVGRLIGVAQVTSAFLWCVFLALLLFPWQSFLQNTDFTGEFRFPGVLYNWAELTHRERGAKFISTGFDAFTFGRWARFVGVPVVSVILLLVIQAKSSRGLRAALGESELDSPGDLSM